MRAVDRESMAVIRRRMDEVQELYSVETLLKAGDDVRAVGTLLVGQPRLRRILSNPGVDPEIRLQLLRDLVASHVSPLGLQFSETVVRARWRSPLALLDTFETVAAASFLSAASKEGALARVEDELFQFWQVMQANPRLTQALDEEAVPVSRRGELVAHLVGESVHPTSLRLLELALTQPAGLTSLPAIERLMDLAAETHRARIAFVTSAVALDEEQVDRLGRQLSSEQGRSVDVKVTVDPSILGGMIVRVGDEMIDGSVARRLRDARAGIARTG